MTELKWWSGEIKMLNLLGVQYVYVTIPGETKSGKAQHAWKIRRNPGREKEKSSPFAIHVNGTNLFLSELQYENFTGALRILERLGRQKGKHFL